MGNDQSSLGYKLLTREQQNYLICEQIIIGMMTGFLIVATLYNTWTYLIKQKKY